MTVSTADTVPAALHYFSPPADGSKPYIHINADASTGQRQRNWTTVAHDTEIENIRGKEHTVSLDTTGFQFFKGAVPHTTFENDEVIEKEYYPQSIDLVKQITGASQIVVFDHTIRRHRPGEVEDTPQKRQPVPQVHIDQTKDSSIARVHRHLPAEDVPALLSKRFQIINLWRPIHHVALDYPLALCDYRTVDRAHDLVATTLRYPVRDGETFNGETFSVKYNPANRWKYVRGMEPDEFVLIKCFDSQDDGKTAIFTPHTAFEDSTTPKDAPLRESIELRLLVFYD